MGLRSGHKAVRSRVRIQMQVCVSDLQPWVPIMPYLFGISHKYLLDGCTGVMMMNKTQVYGMRPRDEITQKPKK